MKNTQTSQSLKKRLAQAMSKGDSQRSSSKENPPINLKPPVHSKMLQKTTSVEIYLEVPSYKPAVVAETGTKVLTEISNTNLRSPPFLANGTIDDTLTSQINDFTIQCSDLARFHYTKQLLAKCLFALLQNKTQFHEQANQEKRESLTERQYKATKLVETTQKLNSTGHLHEISQTNQSLQMSTTSEHQTPNSSSHNEQIACRYNSSTLKMKAFISWKRYHHVKKLQTERDQLKLQTAKSFDKPKQFDSIKSHENDTQPTKQPAQQKNNQKDEYQYKSESIVTSQSLQQLSRVLFQKQSKYQNKDLESLEQPSHFKSQGLTQEMEILKSAHKSSQKTAHFSDASYLQILSYPNAYQDRLKFKVITALRGYLTLRQNHADIFRNVNLIQKAFSVFKNNYKEVHDKKLEIFSKKSDRIRRIKQVFNQWSILVFQEKLLRQVKYNSSQNLLKRIIEVMKNNTAQSYLKFQKLQLFQMGQCFQKLRMNCLSMRIEKIGNSQVIDHMNLFIKRRVFKMLFNMVNLTQRVKKLRAISARLQDSQILRHCLKTWNIKSKLTEFKVRNFNRFMKRFFDPWLRNALKRVHTKQSFVVKRALVMNKKAIDAWKYHTLEARSKRQQIFQLFQIRAKCLQKQVFRHGLVEYCKQVKLKRSLNLAASIYLAQRLQTSCMQQLKAYLALKRRGKVTKQKHNYLKTIEMVKGWCILAKHTRKLRKYQLKSEIRVKSLTLQKLKFYIRYRRFKATRRSLAEKLYVQTLTHKALSRFHKMMVVLGHQLSTVQKSIGVLNKRAKITVIKALKTFSNDRVCSKVKIFKIQTKHQLTLKRKYLYLMLQLKQDLVKEKQAVPFLVERQQRLCQEVITALRLYSLKRIEQRSFLEKLQQVRHSKLMHNVLKEMLEFTTEHKLSQQFKYQADKFNKFNLLKKSMKAMFQWKLFRAQEGSCTLQVCSNLRSNIFVKWFNFVHDYLPKLKVALVHFKKNLFLAFKRYAQSRQKIRLHRRQLKIVTDQFVTYRCINQAIHWLYLNSQVRIHQRSKIELINKIWKSRVYQKWAELIPSLKLANRNNCKAFALRGKHLTYKALEMMYVYTQYKKNHRQIISAFRRRDNQRVLSDCLSALIDHASELKLKGSGFAQIMQPIVQKSLAMALRKWISQHAETLKFEMVNQFYWQKVAKTQKAIVFKLLHHNKEVRQKKKSQNLLIEQHYKFRKLHQVFIQFKQQIDKKLKIKRNNTLLVRQEKKRLLSKTFKILVQWFEKKQNFSDKIQKIKKAQNHKYFTIVFNALINHKIEGQKIVLIQLQRCENLARSLIQKWKNQYQISKKLSTMVSILQQEEDRIQLKRVFPTLTFYCEFKNVSEKLEQNRTERLVRLVFTSFVNQLIFQKLIKALVLKAEKAKLTRLFQGFRRQITSDIVQRQLIVSQIDLQDRQEKLQVCRTVFNEFAHNRFIRKAKRWAIHKSNQNYMQSAFNSLRYFTEKKNILNCHYNLYCKQRMSVFFELWQQTREVNQREKAALQVLTLNTKNKVFKQLVHNCEIEKTIKQFKAAWQAKRLKFLGVRGLQQNVCISRFHKFVYNRIDQQNKRTIMQDAFSLLIQGCKKSKLEKSLAVYQRHRLQKAILSSMKKVLFESNKVRLNLIKLRSSFQQNPNLAKPLLVLKQFTLYKAFISLKERVKRLRFLRHQSRLSAYAFYLRLLRKAYYGLRLNAASQYQNSKSRQIKKLVIQRRWFSQLKVAVQQQKIARQKQTDAAIFRFLNLQRKALKSFVMFFTARCKQKIQNNFALVLCYKNLLTKSFIAMKFNMITRKQTRDSRYQNTIQEVSESHAENTPSNSDKKHYQRSYIVDQNTMNQFGFPSHDSKTELIILSDVGVTLGRSRTYVKSPNEYNMISPRQEQNNLNLSTISNEFVISSTEMGPISSKNYAKLKNLPETMLQNNRQSQLSSSQQEDLVPSGMSATPISSGPHSVKLLD